MRTCPTCQKKLSRAAKTCLQHRPKQNEVQLSIRVSQEVFDKIAIYTRELKRKPHFAAKSLLMDGLEMIGE